MNVYKVVVVVVVTLQHCLEPLQVLLHRIVAVLALSVSHALSLYRNYKHITPSNTTLSTSYTDQKYTKPRKYTEAMHKSQNRSIDNG